jgi:hypothetical protein
MASTHRLVRTEGNSIWPWAGNDRGVAPNDGAILSIAHDNVAGQTDKYDVSFAERISAKVTVLLPFRVFKTDMQMIMETLDQCQTHPRGPRKARALTC